MAKEKETDWERIAIIVCSFAAIITVTAVTGNPNWLLWIFVLLFWL